jgi:hypothetical protein
VSEHAPSRRYPHDPPTTGAHLELPRRLAWEALRLPDMLRDHRSAVFTWSGMLPRSVGGRVVCYFANPILFLDESAGNRLRRLPRAEPHAVPNTCWRPRRAWPTSPRRCWDAGRR